MKNLIIGLLALPVIALIIGAIYLVSNLIICGVGAVVAIVATFAPVVIGGLVSIAIIVGVIYFIGLFTREIIDGVKEGK